MWAFFPVLSSKNGVYLVDEHIVPIHVYTAETTGMHNTIHVKLLG